MHNSLMCAMFYKEFIPFPLKESFKETQVFPFPYISSVMTSINVFVSVILKFFLSFNIANVRVCVFNIRRYMCLCLIKLTPTEFLNASLGNNLLIWQKCIEFFRCARLASRCHRYKNGQMWPLSRSSRAQNLLGETNNWIPVIIPCSTCSLEWHTETSQTIPGKPVREVGVSWDYMRQEDLGWGNSEQV